MKKINIVNKVLGFLSVGISTYLFYVVFIAESFEKVGAFGPLLNRILLISVGIFTYLTPFAVLAAGMFGLFDIYKFFNKTRLVSLIALFLFGPAFYIFKDLHNAKECAKLSMPLLIKDFRPSLTVYLLPIILLTYGIISTFIKKNKKSKVKVLIYGLLSIITISLMLLNHNTLSKETENIIESILSLSFNKRSGGLIGGAIALPMFILLGIQGSLIVLGTIVLTALFFTSNDGIIAISNKLAYEFKRLIAKYKRDKLKEIKVEDKRYRPQMIIKDIKLKDPAELSIQKPKQFEIKKIEPEVEGEDIDGVDAIFKTKEEDPALKAQLIEAMKKKIVKLEGALDEHGIESQVLNYSVGPTITRFELAVSKGTRVKKVVALSDDIAMNLEAKSVRIEAPIPGKNAIGIEIPNDIAESVSFASIIKKKDKKNHLEVVLGKNVIGEDILVDLRKMPHLLVAGRTGSGKSVGINVIISSIVYSAKPSDVRFIMVDPKMVELMPYNDIPHLYVPVITDPKQAAQALKWAVQEMERRYKLLAKAGVRHIDSYNSKVFEKVPYLVVIIDELADLMMVAPASIEESIARIAQKARAVGIHLVIATQRPSVDVITGTIKANLPSRISYSVTSQIDSRTILDVQGAEKLLGRGDMLFLEAGKSNLERIQGAYISDDEVNAFAAYLRKSGKPKYHDEILTPDTSLERDELFDRALEIVRQEGRVSTTLIQRKLKVGYSRAARIMDQFEEAGIIMIGSNGEKELIEPE